MNGDPNFQAGQEYGILMHKLETIQQSVDKIEKGMWPRIESHGQDIKVLQDNVSDLKKSKWWLVGAIGTGFVGALWKLVLAK